MQSEEDVHMHDLQNQSDQDYQMTIEEQNGLHNRLALEKGSTSTNTTSTTSSQPSTRSTRSSRSQSLSGTESSTSTKESSNSSVTSNSKTSDSNKSKNIEHDQSEQPSMNKIDTNSVIPNAKATDNNTSNNQPQEGKKSKKKKKAKVDVLADPMAILTNVLAKSEFQTPDLSEIICNKFYNSPSYMGELLRILPHPSEYKSTIGNITGDSQDDTNMFDEHKLTVMPKEFEDWKVNLLPSAIMNLTSIYEEPTKTKRERRKKPKKKQAKAKIPEDGPLSKPIEHFEPPGVSSEQSKKDHTSDSVTSQAKAVRCTFWRKQPFKKDYKRHNVL